MTTEILIGLAGFSLALWVVLLFFRSGFWLADQRLGAIGELAFWPPGKAICIFFGKTPISESNKPKAASPVNVFGKIIGSEINILAKLKNGERISLEIAK